ncbi:hypothetical protein SODALDRAFT_354401 [Sodiomyces alkalinus F11]|uniref:Uncharacterized protein n=1 Tax=Sodiomyces alkalinus (strain CBS 110278 / VKM F-3762 / F11) TaxID=1314773 RepID=A0A3N2Q697_SODAK|nr:hypothetical protein SODALDRAFT_354401 [Sodiomyces alkalinus F11]ROT42272.1 hypothetical protein SODALDRAFT_354401 [Sodiomyces alkalinus F11]
MLCPSVYPRSPTAENSPRVYNAFFYDFDDALSLGCEAFTLGHEYSEYQISVTTVRKVEAGIKAGTGPDNVRPNYKRVSLKLDVDQRKLNLPAIAQLFVSFASLHLTERQLSSDFQSAGSVHSGLLRKLLTLYLREGGQFVCLLEQNSGSIHAVSCRPKPLTSQQTDMLATYAMYSYLGDDVYTFAK